ncbi:MAG: hypothetical protein LC731_05595, partial [Acidobacteria bacterium]|nr:hypothetical protein [Acidobacteriota bacterium]
MGDAPPAPARPDLKKFASVTSSVSDYDPGENERAARELYGDVGPAPGDREAYVPLSFRLEQGEIDTIEKSTPLARRAVFEYARQQKIPDEVTKNFLDDEELAGNLTPFDMKTGSDRLTSAELKSDPKTYDAETNTVTIKVAQPVLDRLAEKWEKEKSATRRFVDDVGKVNRGEAQPGQLLIDAAAPSLANASKVADGLDAFNAFGNSFGQVQLNALKSAFQNEYQRQQSREESRQILSNIPQAVSDELQGKDSNIENPAVTVENYLLGSTMERIDPRLKPAVNGVTDFFTSPDNLLFLGAGKAIKGMARGGRLLNLEQKAASRLGFRPRFERVADDAVRVTVQDGPRPFSFVVNPKDVAARKALVAASGEAGFLRVPALSDYVSTAKKAGLTVLDISNSYKAVKSAYDVSAAGRQGLLLVVNHPIEAAKSFISQFKAMPSDEAFSKMMRPYLDTPMQDVREKAGLWLSSVNNPEEVFAGANLAESIPGVGASERAYNYFLDRMRVHAFDSFYAANPKATETDLREVARFINYASGRGGLGPLEGTKAAKVIQQAFWSPRLNVSRAQVALSPVLLKSPLARRYAARNLATFVSAGTGFLGMAKLAGADVEADPRSADFGRIIIGAQHYDLFGGFTTQARYLAQLITGDAKPLGSDVIKERDRITT